jgi:DNA invertase Pin-like site-specific DNA recombinase
LGGIEMDSESRKAALYARVSSDKQDTDLSISAQLKAIRDYAEKNSYVIAREFIDEAESGRTASRPAFKDMIALARTRILL